MFWLSSTSCFMKISWLKRQEVSNFKMLKTLNGAGWWSGKILELCSVMHRSPVEYRSAQLPWQSLLVSCVIPSKQLRLQKQYLDDAIPFSEILLNSPVTLPFAGHTTIHRSHYHSPVTLPFAGHTTIRRSHYHSPVTLPFDAIQREMMNASLDKTNKLLPIRCT